MLFSNITFKIKAAYPDIFDLVISEKNVLNIMNVTKFASILPTENILKGWDVETTLSVYLVIVKQCTNCKKT